MTKMNSFQVYVSSFGWKITGTWGDCNEFSTLRKTVLKRIGLPEFVATQSFYFTSNCRILQDGDVLHENNRIVHLLPRLPGGKGGFGSMLRAIGAQIEKTTNREACRDLSGRRLRDINEEMRLKKWIAKQAELEQERVERRRERLEKKLADPPHEFNDPEYDKYRSLLTENVNDALRQGLTVEKSLVTAKRSAPETKNIPKKPKLWFGLEEELSDDDDGDNSDTESPEQCDQSSGNYSNDRALENFKVDTSDNLAVKTSQTERITLESKPSTSGCVTEDETIIEKRLDDVSVVSINDDPSQLHNVQPGSETNEVLGSDSVRLDKNDDYIEGNKTKELQSLKMVDLKNFNTVEELEALGLDILKFALKTMGLKCGGTLRQRAERLLSVKRSQQQTT